MDETRPSAPEPDADGPPVPPGDGVGMGLDAAGTVEPEESAPASEDEA